MSYALPVDTSNHVHNVPHVEQPPKHHVSMGVDAPMSFKMNYNPSHGYHNTTRRTSTCFDTLPGANVYHTKDMLRRRVPSLHHPSSTSGHRTPMSMTSAPLMDASSRVHNTSHGCHYDNPLTVQYGSKYEAHNASIQNRLEKMMADMGVTNPDRR